MKAFKRQIVNHLKAGKPFFYNGWQHSEPNTRDIMTLEPFKRSTAELIEDDSYHLKSFVKRKSDDALIFLDSASLRIKTGGVLAVLLSCGSVHATVNLNYDNIILLDKNHKPITK